MTVACVLRSGGDFGPEWVTALRAGVAEYSDRDVVCLTDMDVPAPTVPLKHGWSGWWSKIELFRPGLFDGPVLYLDLDTLVLGDVGVFSDYTGRLAVLSDLYQPRKAASGVLLFDGTDPPPIYDRFARDPMAIMQRHSTRSDEWYRRAWGTPDRVQKLWPDTVVSFKKHCRDKRPTGPVLVCGHGQPRFSDPAAGWAHELWRSRC